MAAKVEKKSLFSRLMVRGVTRLAKQYEEDEQFKAAADPSTREEVVTLATRSGKFARFARTLAISSLLAAAAATLYSFAADNRAPSTTLDAVHVPVELINDLSTKVPQQAREVGHSQGGLLAGGGGLSGITTFTSDFTGILTHPTTMSLAGLLFILLFGFAAVTGEWWLAKFGFAPVLLVANGMVLGMFSDEDGPSSAQGASLSQYEQFREAQESGSAAEIARFFSGSPAAEYVLGQVSLVEEGLASQATKKTVEFLRNDPASLARDKPVNLGFTPRGDVTYAMEIAVDGRTVLPASIAYQTTAQEASDSAQYNATMLRRYAWLAGSLSVGLWLFGMSLARRVNRIRELTLA